MDSYLLRPQGSPLTWVFKINLDPLKVAMTNPGEGNGTPLQYSCLENPMDGGAWWAAVYGVTQSRTLLK